MTLDGLAPLSIAAFAVTCLLIELTPGPNMTWLVLATLREGRLRGFMAVAGIALGLSIVGIISAAGLAEIIQNSESAYNLLRWAGIIFLLYLAFEGWRGSDNPVSAPGTRYFLRGLMVNLLNPKAFIFYISVLPTFVSEKGPLLTETLSLTAIYVLIATSIHAALVALAGSLTPFFTVPERQIIVRRALALALAAVAIWFAWTTSR
ncbi:MAG: LysE family translocator [Asticcacaulis sp.]|uniref:LysE family translocator n=1 Tax=Asticcacaulis sp. TaxID=1872648 RepID=UPI003F7B7E6E